MGSEYVDDIQLRVPAQQRLTVPRGTAAEPRALGRCTAPESDRRSASARIREGSAESILQRCGVLPAGSGYIWNYAEDTPQLPQPWDSQCGCGYLQEHSSYRSKVLSAGPGRIQHHEHSY